MLSVPDICRSRCFRCLKVGHIAMFCGGPNRRGRCYFCSGSSHRAVRCVAGTPKCPLCADLLRPDGHALGADGCVPPRRWWGHAPKKKRSRRLSEELSSSEAEVIGATKLRPSSGGGGSPRATREVVSSSVTTPPKEVAECGGTAVEDREEKRRLVPAEERGEGKRPKDKRVSFAMKEVEGWVMVGLRKGGSNVRPTSGTGGARPHR